MTFFSFFNESAKSIKLSYTFTNVKSFSISGFPKVYSGNGTASATETITTSGTYRPLVAVQFKENLLGSVSIDIDNVSVVAVNNLVRKTKVRQIPCKAKEYSIESARVSCGDGYRKTSRTRYRTAIDEYRRVRNGYPWYKSKTIYGNWVTTKPSTPRSSNPTNNIQHRTGRIITETSYFCTAESNCTEPETYTEDTYNTSYSKRLGSYTALSQATIDEQERLKREAEAERLRLEKEKADRAKAELARLERIRAARKPILTIATPTDNQLFIDKRIITLSGSARDETDGDISSSINWRVSGTASLTRTGSAVNIALAKGDYTITASVTDSDGNTASKSVKIRLTERSIPTIPEPPKPTQPVTPTQPTNPTTPTQPTPTQPEPVVNDGRSVYRIITPKSTEIIRGQKVPRLRYQSVRRLDPNTVALYLSRGFEIQNVDQDTPLSYSTPYSPSVLARAEILKPETNVSPVRKNSRRGVGAFRASFMDRQINYNTGGGVKKRDNERRALR